MLRRLIFFTPLIVAALFFYACSDDDNSVSSTPGKTNVRVIHASYDAPAVDVSVNGTNAISGLAYGISSGYAELDAGEAAIRVTPTGQTQPVVINADLVLEDDLEYTIFASGALANIAPVVAVDDRSPVADMAKIRLVHLSPDAPVVDLRLNNADGPNVFSTVLFGDAVAYTEVAQGSYVFAVATKGSTDELVRFQAVTLEAGNVYTVTALGTLAEDDYPFTARVFVDNGNGTTSLDLVPFADDLVGRADVRFIHTSYDAPAVDVTANSQKIFGNLAYGASSSYRDLSTGSTNFKVMPAGAMSPVVIDVDALLEKDISYTAFAADALVNIAPVLVVDDRAEIAGAVKIRFAHLSPDAPAVDIKLNDGSGPAVFENYAFKGVADYTQVNAGNYIFAVTPTGSQMEVVRFLPVSLTASTVYTVVAHGTLSASDDYPFVVRVFVDNDAGSAFVDLEADPLDDAGQTNVRFIHASYDAPPVDIQVNTVQAFSNIAYGNTGGFATINAGRKIIRVSATDDPETVVVDQILSFDADKNYTLIAGNGLSRITAYQTEGDVAAAAGEYKLRNFHMVPDAPAATLDYGVSGTTDVMSFGTYTGDYVTFTQIQPDTLTVTFADGNDTTVRFAPVLYEFGKAYSVYFMGTFDGDDDYPIFARVYRDSDGSGDRFFDLQPINE
jgi:hypothetical protein